MLFILDFVLAIAIKSCARVCQRVCNAFDNIELIDFFLIGVKYLSSNEYFKPLLNLPKQHFSNLNYK